MVSLAGKWPWLEREQDFQGAAGGAHRFKGVSRKAQLERFGTPPLPKALALAKAFGGDGPPRICYTRSPSNGLVDF